jgi:hypothetical protein
MRLITWLQKQTWHDRATWYGHYTITPLVTWHCTQRLEIVVQHVSKSHAAQMRHDKWDLCCFMWAQRPTEIQVAYREHRFTTISGLRIITSSSAVLLVIFNTMKHFILLFSRFDTVWVVTTLPRNILASSSGYKCHQLTIKRHVVVISREDNSLDLHRREKLKSHIRQYIFFTF